jgi:hypothetical protein
MIDNLWCGKSQIDKHKSGKEYLFVMAYRMVIVIEKVYFKLSTRGGE